MMNGSDIGGIGGLTEPSRITSYVMMLDEKNTKQNAMLNSSINLDHVTNPCGGKHSYPPPYAMRFS